MARHSDGTSGWRLSGSTSSLSALNNSTDSFTLAFWVKLSSTALTNKYIGSFSGGGSVQVSPIFGFVADKIELYQDGGTGNCRTGSGITISDTNWHHVAYRMTAGGNWDYFLDGTKTTIGTPSFVFATLTTVTWFAAAGGGAECACDLADIAVWSTAVSDANIAALADGSKRPSDLPTNGLNYWPLGTAGSTEPDDFGSDDLTVSGVTQSDDPPVWSTTATAYTLTGPVGDLTRNTESGDFTVEPNGDADGDIVVTPSDGGAGGVFNPASVTFSDGTSTAKTFKYTPRAAGGASVTISCTNNGGLTDPADVTKDVNVVLTQFRITGTPTLIVPSSADYVIDTEQSGSIS